MKCAEIIARVDSLSPNQYSVNDKLSWLSELDGKIFLEVILTHEDIREDIISRAEHDDVSGQLTWPSYLSSDDAVIVDATYGMDMYCYYLQAMIALNNAESTKYNAATVAFNNAYQSWANWYNRTHRPVQLGKRFLF